MVFSLLVLHSLAISPLTKEQLDRRTLSRFTRGHADNSICWDRHGIDSFISVVDAHQHPMPFGGPEVPFDEYTGWMKDHGTLFAVFMGIGQRIVKQNVSDPECCYYLHCPTYAYPVIPMTQSDELNAEARAKYYTGKAVEKDLHLRVAATFANLQKPSGEAQKLRDLWRKYPKTFTWAGELNVFKHALAGNGFFSDFTGPRLTVARVESGELDELFSLYGPAQPDGEHIPTVTLHSDMGCDAYAFPPGSGDGVHPLVCEASAQEMLVAQKDHEWWQATLGPFYSGFFDEETHYPKPNFRKIMHIHVLDAIVGRYPEVKIVWAHLGLSMELQTLHPAVHAHILSSFYERHATNLWSDLSWDVLAKLNFMNFDGRPIEEVWSAKASEDLSDNKLFDMKAVAAERDRLDKVWKASKSVVEKTGSPADTVGGIKGPSYKMAVLLELLHRYPERAITGTDYVASYGMQKEFPGSLWGKPQAPVTGCHKTDANHAMQQTDTSSINMFFDDEAFSKIVLGGNFFEAAGLSTTFAPPPICRKDAVGAEHDARATVLVDAWTDPSMPRSASSSLNLYAAEHVAPQGASEPPKASVSTGALYASVVLAACVGIAVGSAGQSLLGQRGGSVAGRGAAWSTTEKAGASASGDGSSSPLVTEATDDHEAYVAFETLRQLSEGRRAHSSAL